MQLGLQRATIFHLYCRQLTGLRNSGRPTTISPAPLLRCLQLSVMASAQLPPQVIKHPCSTTILLLVLQSMIPVCSVHAKATGHPAPLDISSPSLAEITCDCIDVMKAIKRLRHNTASGPDGISATMLKGSCSSICGQLACLFNASFSRSHATA